MRESMSFINKECIVSPNLYNKEKTTEAQFIVADWGDKVDLGIGLS
jgi:hypothetical protein